MNLQLFVLKEHFLYSKAKTKTLWQTLIKKKEIFLFISQNFAFSNENKKVSTEKQKIPIKITRIHIRKKQQNIIKFLC